jgi:hypothetical protein
MPWTRSDRPPHFLLVFTKKHMDLHDDWLKYADLLKENKTEFIRKSMYERLERLKNESRTS